MVLPSELSWRAPGVHQQGAPGATGEVGLGGVAPSATGQARGPHRRAGAPGEEGVDGGGRHRELPPAEGDPSRREGPADLPAHPGSQVEGSRTSNKLLSHTTATRRAKYAVAEFPQNPEDLWRIKMRPEPGYISLVSFVSEFIMSCAAPFLAPDSVSVVFCRG